MKKGIIGKKLGMTQIFDAKGNVIPVTLIEAGPCVVAQKKTVDNDGYPTVRHTVEHTVLQTTHHAYGELRLTVLTKSQTPTIKHLTAANILETLLK